ncbi:TadE/TadG family type IV pilus assembly protein [Allosalinactinospora lopnorensis]|uniref:TadE/TadG family type IV pilus assembly protein n=1 Tax=Allosalinactinospora lopnorensis TaxID=1352348 RepID=UPI0009E51620|nr:TadE/TadG family type IV pilus assembly protein [Allosalinactinospora lopnorensis]
MIAYLFPAGRNRRTAPGHLCPVHRRTARRQRRAGDRGSQFVEFAAYLPLFLLVFVLAMETFAAFLALERLGNAARTGARVAAEQGPDSARQAAADSLPSWLDGTVTVGTNSKNGYYTEVRAEIPFIFPATADLNIPLSRRVDMPNL